MIQFYLIYPHLARKTVGNAGKIRNPVFTGLYRWYFYHFVPSPGFGWNTIQDTILRWNEVFQVMSIPMTESLFSPAH